MKISETKSELQEIVARSRELKLEIGKAVEIARILMKEEDIHEMKDLSLNAAKNLASIESYLNEFQRISPKGKRFAVKTN